MRTRHSPKNLLKPIDRLRREGQQPDQTGLDTERSIENLIVMGASAGGHGAIKEVLKALSSNIPASVILMQHMSAKSASDFLPRFTNWLAESTPLPIVHIQSGERIRSGVIYIAPPGMSVTLKGRKLAL